METTARKKLSREPSNKYDDIVLGTGKLLFAAVCYTDGNQRASLVSREENRLIGRVRLCFVHSARLLGSIVRRRSKVKNYIVLRDWNRSTPVCVMSVFWFLKLKISTAGVCTPKTSLYTPVRYRIVRAVTGRENRARAFCIGCVTVKRCTLIW